MNDAITVLDGSMTLPSLIQRAANHLTSATSAAEVLEARDMASVAYDASKKAARLAKAKGAHDELIAKAHRTQADALLIESRAKSRLADEYDAAQDRGEVATGGAPRPTTTDGLATAADIGLTYKDVHDARKIRDAEKAEPGIVENAVNDLLERGEEPTRAAVNRVIDEALAVIRGTKLDTEEYREELGDVGRAVGGSVSEQITRAKADLSWHRKQVRALRAAWKDASEAAREEFLEGVGAEIKRRKKETNT